MKKKGREGEGRKAERKEGGKKEGEGTGEMGKGRRKGGRDHLLFKKQWFCRVFEWFFHVDCETKWHLAAIHHFYRAESSTAKKWQSWNMACSG